MLTDVRTYWLRITLVGFLAWTLSLVAQGVQATSPKAIRIGDIGAKLTDQEVADLEKALPAGDKPWLLVGVKRSTALIPPGTPQTIKVDAYMPPTTKLPELRRGLQIVVG